MTMSVPTRQCGHRGRSPRDDARAGSGAGGAAIRVRAVSRARARVRSARCAALQSP